MCSSFKKKYIYIYISYLYISRAGRYGLKSKPHFNWTLYLDYDYWTIILFYIYFFVCFVFWPHSSLKFCTINIATQLLRWDFFFLMKVCISYLCDFKIIEGNKLFMFICWIFLNNWNQYCLKWRRLVILIFLYLY